MQDSDDRNHDEELHKGEKMFMMHDLSLLVFFYDYHNGVNILYQTSISEFIPNNRLLCNIPLRFAWCRVCRTDRPAEHPPQRAVHTASAAE